jgi:hypothetical protein
MMRRISVLAFLLVGCGTTPTPSIRSKSDATQALRLAIQSIGISDRSFPACSLGGKLESEGASLTGGEPDALTTVRVSECRAMRDVVIDGELRLLRQGASDVRPSPFSYPTRIDGKLRLDELTAGTRHFLELEGVVLWSFDSSFIVNGTLSANGVSYVYDGESFSTSDLSPQPTPLVIAGGPSTIIAEDGATQLVLLLRAQNALGEPKAGVVVLFSVSGDMGNSTLAALSSTTNDKGEARMVVNAGDRAASFTVTATAPFMIDAKLKVAIP